jgi:ligand-binding SRPBCC domain-containing protein
MLVHRVARVKSRFESEQWLPVPVEKVFAFFADPHNLPRIMPPAMDAKLLNQKLVNARNRGSDEPPMGAGQGSEMVLSFRVIPGLPFRGKWVARIKECQINHFFTDIQVKGPFKSWHHRHEFVPQARDGVAGTLIRDAVNYEVGFGPPGALADRLFVRRQLQATFAWRQKAVRELLGK